MLTISCCKRLMSCSNVGSFVLFLSTHAYSIQASLCYSHPWQCSRTWLMTWKLKEVTQTALTKASLEATSLTCLISHCFIRPSTIPDLMANTDPLGYQMDASYYYLKLHWSVPCGPNSVITFPGASWLKPWYWWSWPVLPLGYQWHEQRLQTLGYSDEMPIVFLLSLLYIGIIAMSKLARPSLSKLCYRPVDRNITLIQSGIKLAAIWSIMAAYIVPFFLIPHTIHPIIGWGLYLLGSFSFCSIAINAFLLPPLAVISPLLGILGSLMVMAYPWYNNGIKRALAVFFYAFCFSPVLWVSGVKVVSSLQGSLDRESFIPRSLVESPPASVFNKLY